MKPLGPIPAGFEAIDGELAIGDTPVSDLVGRAGRTPLFIYSRERIARRFAELRAAMLPAPDQCCSQEPSSLERRCIREITRSFL